MKKVLITGADGFVGRHLCKQLARSGWDVHATVRSAKFIQELGESSTVHPIADIADETVWHPLLQNADAVVHLAARVHAATETISNAASEYRRINTDGTSALARAAAEHGVRLFVFLSTVKVHGEQTLLRPFSEADAPSPCDPYSSSKWEAELALNTIAASSNMRLAILRPPLIYGPGVKGNFLRLMKLVGYQAPLPLASICNSRSFLYVGNLTSAIETILRGPARENSTFLLSDGCNLSTPELIKKMAAPMGIPIRLFRFPPALLLALSTMLGKGEKMRRMVESLVVDSTHIQKTLGWSPPFTLEQGFAETAHWMLNAKK